MGLSWVGTVAVIDLRLCPLGERAGGVEGGGGVRGVSLHGEDARWKVGPAQVRWRCRVGWARWGGAVSVGR